MIDTKKRWFLYSAEILISVFCCTINLTNIAVRKYLRGYIEAKIVVIVVLVEKQR